MVNNGLLHPQLKVGNVSSISANLLKVNLDYAGSSSATHLQGSRYGKGEVGEIVLIEGQQNITLGRIIEVRLPERERNEISSSHETDHKISAIGIVKLLGSIDLETIKVEAGLSNYPRLGDKVFSATSDFLAKIPQLINVGKENLLKIELGDITGDVGCKLNVSPEELFGRHCAILGSTGGGKSWTTAKLLQECAKYPKAKIILIDATSEYRSLPSINTLHYHLGNPINQHDTSLEFKIPPTDFEESDFLAMFDPSGKVQGPKLREAIKSLRLAWLEPDIFPKGYIMKVNQPKVLYRKALNKNKNSSLVDDPNQPFDVSMLTRQLVEECCWSNDDSWGAPNNDLGYCSSLLTRIQAVIYSSSFKSVFSDKQDLPPLSCVIDNFLKSDKQILRVCCSDVSYEFYAREIIANVVGRKLLSMSRSEKFRTQPVIVFLDEAHNFLGKRVGSEEHSIKLNSFELIAKEGRKYGLNICLATQRPRDITEGVLSQMGTLLVHRLTNDRDREIVERACGEIDKSSASFLPNLKQGEVAIVGVSFPIPITVQIDAPSYPPKSDGPKLSECWI